MPKKKILDSARDYLARMHATRAKDVPSILRQGLRPMPHPLDGQSDPSVFMTAGRRLDNTFYGMAGRDALIKYRIPKDWHRRNVVPNSHYMDARVEKDPDWPYSYEANVENRKTVDVMNGGRSTTYRDVVPASAPTPRCAMTRWNFRDTSSMTPRARSLTTGTGTTMRTSTPTTRTCTGSTAGGSDAQGDCT